MSSIKCAQCGLVNWAGAAKCKRCGASIDSTHQLPTSSEPQTVQPSEDVHSKRGVRKAGLKLIRAGALFTALYVLVLIAVIVVNSTNSGYRINFKLISFAGLLPVAVLLSGVLQIFTGVPFQELSNKWDKLAGWQRGLIGISVFVAGLVLVVLVCVVIVIVLDWRSGRPFF